jgi:hypothetical protein
MPVIHLLSEITLHPKIIIAQGPSITSEIEPPSEGEVQIILEGISLWKIRRVVSVRRRI